MYLYKIHLSSAKWHLIHEILDRLELEDLLFQPWIMFKYFSIISSTTLAFSSVRKISFKKATKNANIAERTHLQINCHRIAK